MSFTDLTLPMNGKRKKIGNLSMNFHVLENKNTVTNKRWVKENITMKSVKQYNLK